MPASPPRTGDRAQATRARREQIVQATIEVLAGKGYAATTFEAICGHAGLSSKRLISYHFATKDDLLAAVLTTVIADAAAYMHPRIMAADGPRAQLSAYIRANVEFVAAHPAHVRAVQQIAFNARPRPGVSPDSPGSPGSAEDTALALLAELFERGVRAGAFRPLDARLMATAVRAAIDAAAGPLLDGLDPEHCATELATAFDHATRA
ncbi:TetR/AcrR family transcriptional regulator [Nonomuraea zeae]|uniref:TetR family transcriptional regulator n=1 Tax=Nonomuraea zeae TaxID=1642303 RepID=A0A5S4G9I0_9ACTN|nr:TetR/AcrR family transcriptional regulator [Nonomuraea zeae]TMR29667.1 TetR family transcriptional regulator [Nonomuraea zeae]